MNTASGRALWIGDDDGLELSLARSWAAEAFAARGETLEVHCDPQAAAAAATDPHGNPAPMPRMAIFASDQPARWTLADAVAVSLTWPLIPIVSVAASLVEGRRRSGPALPGVEEVAWHDLPGRLDRWLASWDAGLPGTLGVPWTARRDERLLALGQADRQPLTAPVSIVAATPLDADGVADLVSAAGGTVAAKAHGKPRLDDPSAILVWDVGRLSADALAWLRLLSANRPALRTIILESFPRGDSVQAAVEAGAAAVLGRPVSLEALRGLLHRFQPGSAGLGGAGMPR